MIQKKECIFNQLLLSDLVFGVIGKYTQFTNYKKHPLKDIVGSTIDEKEWYLKKGDKNSLPFNILFALQKKYSGLKSRFARPAEDYLLFEKWEESHFKYAEEHFDTDDYRVLCEAFLMRIYHYIPFSDVHYNYHSKGADLAVM